MSIWACIHIKSTRAYKQVQGHPGLHTNLGSPRVAYGCTIIGGDIQVQVHPGLDISIGASDLAYTYRSTTGYIRVQERMGLQKGMGKLCRYTSIGGYIQVQEQFAYNYRASKLDRIEVIVPSFSVHTIVYTTRRENQRKVTSIQVQRYKCLHIDICIYIHQHSTIGMCQMYYINICNWYGSIFYFDITSQVNISEF